MVYSEDFDAGKLNPNPNPNHILPVVLSTVRILPEAFAVFSAVASNFTANITRGTEIKQFQ